MIVRESPRRNRNTNSTDTSWPPRSPHEALLSSPSRQKRIQSNNVRRSVSPSPIKHKTESQTLGAIDDDLSEEDDEETLQLKLARIEAQLKLKKLKKSRTTKENVAPGKSVASSANDHVEVPVSPIRKPPMPPQDSPKRVQLGIDKGLKASDVSLKRPPPNRSLHDRSLLKSRKEVGPPPKSFSERLAEARNRDTTLADNQERFKQNRSRGFGVANPVQQHASKGDPKSGATLPRSSSAKSTSSSSQPSRTKSMTSLKLAEFNRGNGAAELESFSGFRLSQRHLAHTQLEEAFEGKEMYSIPRLLKEVVSPDYNPPDIAKDYVVFGIIASKSEPKNQVETGRQKSDAAPDGPAHQRTKFMVMRLTDLKWELDLFLFDAGFDTFWKIPEGSIVAMLNPTIMPPRPHLRDTGKFSLKLSSSEDTLLELGTAKDLGWCQSIKKDGQQCSQWINARKTEHCDFHVNLRFEKDRASRPEVNSMAGMSMFSKKKGGKKKGKEYVPWEGKYKDRDLKKEGAFHDWEAHENAYSVPKGLGLGISAAQRFDNDDYVRGSQAEREQKRKAQKANEQKLLKQLSSQGSGIGRDYARKRHGEDQEDESDIFLNAARFEKESKDISTLGLLDKKASNIKLSPTGRKGLSKQPMGWAGAFKRGLLEPTRGVSPERKVPRVLEKPESPTKQARFMLDEKGLRLPGRESLGNTEPQAENDDDSDGLDIV